MKAFALLFLLTFLYAALGQSDGNFLNSIRPFQFQASESQYQNELAQERYQQQLENYQRLLQRFALIKSENGGRCFRVAGGETNCIYNTELCWEHLTGITVNQTLPDGILAKWKQEGFEDTDIFVANFPFQTVDDQPLKGFFAKRDGTFTYTAVSGGSRTVRKYDYGIVVSPSKEMQDAEVEKCETAIANNPLVVQAKAEAESAKKSVLAAQAAKAKALKSNQDAAAKGDAYGLMRMGERFRDGDGVDKDLATAKEYFNKAVAAGSPTAAEELSKLNPQNGNKIGN